MVRPIIIFMILLALTLFVAAVFIPTSFEPFAIRQTTFKQARELIDIWGQATATTSTRMFDCPGRRDQYAHMCDPAASSFIEAKAACPDLSAACGKPLMASSAAYNQCAAVSASYATVLSDCTLLDLYTAWAGLMNQHSDLAAYTTPDFFMVLNALSAKQALSLENVDQAVQRASDIKARADGIRKAWVDSETVDTTNQVKCPAAANSVCDQDKSDQLDALAKCTGASCADMKQTVQARYAACQTIASNAVQSCDAEWPRYKAWALGLIKYGVNALYGTSAVFNSVRGLAAQQTLDTNVLNQLIAPIYDRETIYGTYVAYVEDEQTHPYWR